MIFFLSFTTSLLFINNSIKNVCGVCNFFYIFYFSFLLSSVLIHSTSLVEAQSYHMIGPRPKIAIVHSLYDVYQKGHA